MTALWRVVVPNNIHDSFSRVVYRIHSEYHIMEMKYGVKESFNSSNTKFLILSVVSRIEYDIMEMKLLRSTPSTE